MVSTLRSQRLTARAVARDIITGEICSRCLFIVDTRRLWTDILDARCSDEAAAPILRVHLIPCRWRRQFIRNITNFVLNCSTTHSGEELFSCSPAERKKLNLTPSGAQVMNGAIIPLPQYALMAYTVITSQQIPCFSPHKTYFFFVTVFPKIIPGVNTEKCSLLNLQNTLLIIRVCFIACRTL